jgi:DNA-binding XRE family transcriptional regulator
MKKELARLIRQTRKELGLNGESQQDLLRKVREAFELTNEELAETLGVGADTLMAYLAPETAKKFRQMPQADKLILARILKGRRERKG